MTVPSHEPLPRRVHDPENIVGLAIGGRYLIRRCISQGGMGVIYLARQESLDRDVVLKVVRHDRADAEGIARFRREARSLSMLSHPNVVQIFDHGFDEDTGLYFIVMEYIRGLTLSRYRKLRGLIPLEEFLPIAAQMLEGAAEVHRHGLLHRDLKPSNVMLTSPDGVRLRIKILDFGLSKSAVSADQLTQANSFLGSVMYMAPELIRSKGADARADVYSLGVTFYQMLSGSNPIEGDDPYRVLMQQVAGGARPLATVMPPGYPLPDPLYELIDRCLSPQVDYRPQDARVMLDLLQMALPHVTPHVEDAVHATLSSLDPAIPYDLATARTTDSHSSTALRHSDPRRTAPRTSRLALWSLLGVGGALTVSMGVLLGLLLVLNLVMMRPVPVPAAAPPPAPVSASEVLREQALRALREGHYDEAVTLTTEAVAVAPDEGDLKELLSLVTDLRDRSTIAPPEPAAPERVTPERHSPEPERPVALPVGIAVITSSPGGVAFEIEGLLSGQTPFRALDVPAGSYEVRFSVDGRVIHSAQMTVPEAGLEILDVDLEAFAHKEPPPAPPAVPSQEKRVYVYVPSSIKPRVIEEALRSSWSGATVTAFGSFRELDQAMDSAPPSAVIAPRSVLDALRLPVHLQGRDAAGATTERYLLLGKRPLSRDEIEGSVIGTVDLVGRDSAGEFVASMLRLPHAPQIKRVSEEADLLPLLQFGAADAILLPEGAARKLMQTTQMELAETEVASGAGLPAVSVLDDSDRSGIEAAVRGLGAQASAKIGIASWDG